jgi:uncharacterized protein YdaU (DUF1376 family)
MKKQNEKLPYMPYYVADWSHKTARMTMLQRGAIIGLTEYYWTEHTLPNDDAQLIRLMRCTPDEWAAVKPAVMSLFQEDGDKLCSAELDAQLQDAGDRYSRNKNRSFHAVEAKKRKRRGHKLVNQELVNESESESESDSESDSDPESHTHSAFTPSECECLFAEFWLAFPHRDGENPKTPAWHKFCQALNQKVPPEKIIEGAKRYAGEINRSKKPDKWRYIPQTWRWLDEERWHDDPSDGSMPVQPDHPRFNEFAALWDSNMYKSGSSRDRLSRYFSEIAAKTDPDQIIAEARTYLALEGSKPIAEQRLRWNDPVGWMLRFDREAISAVDARDAQAQARRGGGPKRLASV